MNEMQLMEDDEISLFDLYEKLRQGWRGILSGILSGLFVASLAILFIPSKYEAVAMLQAGKVAGTVVEDPSIIVERLKSPALLIEIAQDVGDQDWMAAIHDGEGRNVLTALVPKTNPSVVEVRIKARSPESAKKIADSATEMLIKRQNELSKGVLGKIRFDLDVAKEKLARVDSELSALSKTLSSTPVKDERFSQVSLLISLRLQKESEMFSLRQTANALEISLLPPATQSAKVLEDIFVSRKPVSPKKTLLLALGFVGGFLIGVMFVFFNDTWQRMRERRSAV